MLVWLLIHLTCSIQSLLSILSRNFSSFKKDELECYSDLSLSNSIFSNNVICIIRCEFNSLKSQSNGGAIYVNLINIFCIKNFIDQCSFTECKSKNGGAIYFNIEKNYTTEIQNSIFIKNSASNYSGGSIYVISKTKCSFSIKNSTFINNSAIIEGGSIYLSNIDLLLENSVFNMNKLSSSSISYGGAIQSQNAEGLFINCSFITNIIYASDHDSFGGAISLSDSIGSFKKCNFTSNLVYTDSRLPYSTTYFSYGGAISVYSTSNAKTNFIKSIIECTFNNNTSSSSSNSYGGAVYISNSYDSENSTFINSAFINNTAYSKSHSSCSGAIDFSSSLKGLNTSFIKLTFYNNSAYSKSDLSFGGSISYIYTYLFSKKYVQALFADCVFMNNRANTEGGAIKFSGIIAVFQNCTFNDNFAHNGCDISYNQNENSFFSINHCIFIHNKNENYQIKSIFHFRVNYNKSASNIFTNNRIAINILSYVFDGEIESDWAVLKVRFSKNCLSPFDKIFYKTNEINIFNEYGKEIQTFEKAFETFCDEKISSQKLLTKIKNIFIFLIAVMIILIILVIVFIVLFALVQIKKANKNDTIEPLIDLS